MSEIQCSRDWGETKTHNRRKRELNHSKCNGSEGKANQNHNTTEEGVKIYNDVTPVTTPQKGEEKILVRPDPIRQKKLNGIDPSFPETPSTKFGASTTKHWERRERDKTV